MVTEMIATWQDAIAWGLLVLPLVVLAWAVVWFVGVQAERNRYERYQRFHAIMEQLGNKDGSTADKMAAAYELRNYREYADVISKIFANGHVRTDANDMLQAQLKETLKYVRGPKT